MPRRARRSARPVGIMTLLSVHTTLLSHPQLTALVGQGAVTNITGREAEFHPDGVIDIEPYVRGVPAPDLEGFSVHDDLMVEVVYQSQDGRFDLVHVMTRRKNVYLVVVIENKNDRIHGHCLLDLNKEYGLDAVNDA
jgi:hypothetical protein